LTDLYLNMQLEPRSKHCLSL